MSASPEEILIPILPPFTPDYNSFIQDVTQVGTIPLTELQGRLDGGTIKKNGRFLVRDPRGDVFPNDTPFDASGYTTVREERKLSEPQKLVVTEIATKLNSFESAEKSLADTASFLRDVLDGTIPLTELQGRLDGGTIKKNGRFLVRDPRGDVFPNDTPFDASGYTTVREERKLSEPQKLVVRYLSESAGRRELKGRTAQYNAVGSEIVRNDLSVQQVAQRVNQLGLDDATSADLIALANLIGKVPDKGISEAVVRLFDSGDDSDLLRKLDFQRGKFADISDSTIMQSDISTLEAYVQTSRRISIRGRFWKLAIPDVTQGLACLENYAIVDDSDKLLIQELRGEALGLKRDNLIFNIYEQSGKETPDFMAAALLLGEAAKTIADLQDTKGLSILEIVAESTYASEVNIFFANLVKQLSLDRRQIVDVVAQLETAPIRPNIAGADFFAKFQAAKEQLINITDRIENLAFESELVELRKRFIAEPDVQALVQEIVELPGETAESGRLRQDLLDDLSLIITARRGLDPNRYMLLKDIAIEGIRMTMKTERQTINLTETVPDRNIEAVRNLVRRFQVGIMPLFEALRGGANGAILVDKYVSGLTGDRESYVQRIQALEQQRDLTAIEVAYLGSVELLTVFNPHLVALAKEQPELTSLYLEQYFKSMDAFTKENLATDSYVPVLQIGLGPNGVAAAGELNRVNAGVASQTLFVDSAPLPGGPFGLAKGQSWELNSANSISTTTNNLPDVLPNDEKGISVRSYGSPLAAYPGERNETSDTRTASINTTVDYLLNPDNVSNKRYPTNADLARVLQLQSAMLIDNVLLSTEVVKSEPVNDGKPGNKRVTLEYQNAQGETISCTVRTDSIIIAGGLGKPNYGLNLDGSEAAKVLQKDTAPKDGFPLLTDTIGAFSVLSDPEGEPVAPQGTIVIYGGGNSADVLIEYFGRQFESGNPNLNGIKKVYVLTTAELSKRPRYAQINDLKSRNGQANFLELVSARVADVKELDSGKLQLIDSNNEPIKVGRNGSTKILEADHVISASGFSPTLDEIFKALLTTGESLNKRTGLGKVSLPSNPGFSIADELLADPDVVIVGTGSRADFQNPNKLGQLPDKAREALLRNGAENAVAIGFRTPDTRAAIRLKYTKKVYEAQSDLPVGKQEVIIDTSTTLEVPRSSVAILDKALRPSTRRDIEANSSTLSALFLQALPPLRLTDGPNQMALNSDLANPQFNLQLHFNEQLGQCSLQADMPLPKALIDVIEKALANPYFQSYAMKALSGRRVNRGLEVSMAFSRGRLQYRDPGIIDGKGRTYVEIL